MASLGKKEIRFKKAYVYDCSVQDCDICIARTYEIPNLALNNQNMELTPKELNHQAYLPLLHVSFVKQHANPSTYKPVNFNVASFKSNLTKHRGN